MKKYFLLIAVVVVLGFAALYWCNSCVNNLSNDYAPLQDLNIKPNGTISSPLALTGKLPGTWFFEASFPIIIVDWDGKIIAQVPAQAQDDWMTEGLVPFKAEINFTKPDYGERGAIIFKKDNPSGLPEHDAAVEIPIKFK